VIILSKLSDNIKKFRKANGLSREDLSTKLGISVHTLSKYEQGQREPNVDMLNKISNIFGITINELTGSEKDISISSIEDLFDKFNIGDKSYWELSEISNLSIDTIENMFSPYKKGYSNEDIEILGSSLNLTNNQINEWIRFNNKKPYENKREIERGHWYQCILNYPYEVVDGIDFLEFKAKDLKKIAFELDRVFKLKLKELAQNNES
jgi:transcriptional regulator with XRE-family HTH domain